MKATKNCYIGLNTFNEDCVNCGCCELNKDKVLMWQNRLKYEKSQSEFSDNQKRIKKITRMLYYFEKGK